jgi:DNA helicase-2/ATP-dependent DNA helicase PcrA
MHRISIVGNDEAGRVALSELGLSVRAAKAGSDSWRFETCNADFDVIASTVERIRDVMPLNVIRMARLGSQANETTETNSLPFTSAAHLRAGMAVFDEQGGYDIVSEIERTSFSGNVYDLNVESTHNFIANGIVTHNSIYGWRGAEVDNILRFEHDFPGAQVIRLERNYRSTGHILAAASHLIANNRSRLGKTLFTDDELGNRVKVRGVWDAEAEARLVADDIEQWRQGNRSFAECAVLVRAAWQMRAFEERFLMLRIPYKVIGGPRFFERAEVRDVHAYLRLIRSEDDDLAFERIVNQPKRGVGEGTVQKLHAHAGKPPVRFVTDNGPLFDAGTGEVVTEQLETPGGATRFRTLVGAAREMIITDELPLKARTALRSFLSDLDRWREQSRTMSHVELAEIVLDESGYTEMLRNDKSPQAQTRLENLKELIQSMGQYDTLEAYLEHVALVLDIEAESDGDNVQLSTLHAAKGLEFPLVFLPGWEEQVFPSQRSIDENGEKGLEEERRLAYVGITRARESARISFAANRQIYGRWQVVLPSRFIDELPAANVDAVSDTGYGRQTPGVRDMAVEPFSSGYQSPGWRRAQERGAFSSKPPMIEGESRLVARSGDKDSHYGVGDRIFHQKFGYGRVRAVEGNKLTVDFDKAGEKRVIDSFVVPASAA